MMLAPAGAIAAENASVYDTLPADGTALWNADDAQAAFFRSCAAGHRSLDFALDGAAAVTGACSLSPLSSEIRVRTPAGEATAALAAPGLHNVRNAIAASACAFAAGIPLQAIETGIRTFRPYTGRSQVLELASGATLINDAYNANPDSVRAAIDVLAGTGPDTLLVLGDMGEVGDQGPDFHLEVGRYAAERGIGALYALGEQTAHTVAGFGSGARHFATIEELIKAVRAVSKRDATLLVKGSRFMRMERVVAALTGNAGGGH